MKLMSILGTAAALAGLAAITNGQYTTVALESFDYTAGTNLDMQNGGAGWGNFWVSPFSVDAVVVNGTVIQPIDYTGASTGTAPLSVMAGQSFFYQYWFRDPSAGGGNANFSDGLDVVHTP